MPRAYCDTEFNLEKLFARLVVQRKSSVDSPTSINHDPISDITSNYDET